MNTVLKSYKKVNVKKDLANGKLPKGDYVVRSQDKNHTVLWGGADGQGPSVIVSTPVFVVSEASHLINRIK